MIETLAFGAFVVVCLVSISVLYGIMKQQVKQYKEDLQTGAKIDKIISDNSSISDDEWAKWLQDRNAEQK